LRQPYVIYEDTKTERQGVNLPIFYDHSIVGVIGISGNIKEVMQIGQMAVMTAQLMIENQIFSDMSAFAKESRIKDFLYDWIYLDQSLYHGEFLDRAHFFKIDLSLPRTAVIITSKRIRYSIMEYVRNMLEPNEYIVRQRLEDILILFNSDQGLDKRLEQILGLSKDFLSCYVGKSSDIASITTGSATQTYSIAEALGIQKRILHFSEVSVECLLSSIDVTSEIETVIEKLTKKDPDGILTETICAYVDSTDNQAEVCKQLHVHRNTLNYRLTKAWEVFGLNPKCSRDLMLLYIAIIKMKKG